MSTKVIEPMLNFLPVPKSSRRPHGVVSMIREFFASVREGLAAAQRYERLTAQGTPPQKAVEIVYREHFAEIR